MHPLQKEWMNAEDCQQFVENNGMINVIKRLRIISRLNESLMSHVYPALDATCEESQIIHASWNGLSKLRTVECRIHHLLCPLSSDRHMIRELCNAYGWSR
jgi:hypothetical protein